MASILKVQGGVRSTFNYEIKTNQDAKIIESVIFSD